MNNNEHQRELKRKDEHIKELEGALLEQELQVEELYEMPEDLVLDVIGLGMQFGGLKAVNDLSFNIKQNEIVGLIGPNGAGKTTVFNCITQFYKENTGEVWFRNKQDTVIKLNDVHIEDVVREGLVRTF